MMRKRAGQDETNSQEQVGQARNQEGAGQVNGNQDGRAGQVELAGHGGSVESAGQVAAGDIETTEQRPDDKKTTVHKSRCGTKPGSPGHNKTGIGLPNTIEPGKPGDNARFIRYALASWDLPPIDISDPEQVKNRILEYFNFCADNDRKPTMIGMANWLGVDRDTLNNWKRGVVRSSTHFGIVNKALALLEEQWVDYMQSGKVNPAAGIFLAKNWYGYRDVQDVVVTPSAPYESGSAEDVAKQYIDGMVGYETVDSDGSVD